MSEHPEHNIQTLLMKLMLSRYEKGVRYETRRDFLNVNNTDINWSKWKYSCNQKISKDNLFAEAFKLYICDGRYPVTDDLRWACVEHILQNVLMDKGPCCIFCSDQMIFVAERYIKLEKDV